MRGRFRRIIPFLLVITVAGLVLPACSPKSPVGDPARGKELFSQTVIGSAPGCSTCHSTEPGAVIVGPSLSGVSLRADSAVPGQSAEAYIRTSILDPNAYVVDGFDRGIMYQDFRSTLTEDQINDLTAYLLTLK